MRLHIQLIAGIEKSEIWRVRTVSIGFARPLRGRTHRFYRGEGVGYMTTTDVTVVTVVTVNVM